MSAAPPLTGWVEGIGLRGPGLDGWSSTIDVLAGRLPYVATSTVLVAPAALPPAERRRVGKGVKIALDVGFAAAACAGRDAASLPSVFTSSSGDGDNCDAICRELAADRLISPTRFHNSVHNAAAGYWTIGTGCMQASSALSAFESSFAAGLLEAATQCAADGQPVLLVAFDVEASGALASVTRSRGLVAGAVVIAAEPGEHTLAGFDWSLRPGATAAVAATSEAGQALAGNGMADALPFFEALARPGGSLALPLSATIALRLVPRPLPE
jgi:hypothetical protein